MLTNHAVNQSFVMPERHPIMMIRCAPLFALGYTYRYSQKKQISRLPQTGSRAISRKAVVDFGDGRAVDRVGLDGLVVRLGHLRGQQGRHTRRLYSLGLEERDQYLAVFGREQYLRNQINQEIQWKLIID